MTSHRVGFVLVLLAAAMLAQEKSSSLASEMERLKVHTALLVPSQSVDDSPTWSPDGKYLAVNLQGKWLRIDLATIRLKAASWHDLSIGVLDKEPLWEKIDEKTVQEWAKPMVSGQREVATKSGLKISLTQDDLSTRFQIAEKGKKPRTVWKSDLENCYSLSLSPDERFVSFVCETNGVFVTDLRRLVE